MAHHHDCECGHDHHHEHEHESNSVQIDRYHEAFNKFEPALPDTQTTEAVNALLEKHFQENFTPEVLKTIHGCIDLTSLTSLDTKESIWKMVDTVNDFEGTRPDVPNVAAICVYPLFVETVKQALTAQEVKIASVAGGFPSSQTFTEVKIAETAKMEKRGIRTDKGEVNRQIVADNKLLKEIKARITRLYLWSKDEAEKPQMQQSSLIALWEAQQQLNAPRTRTGKIRALQESAALFSFLQANGIQSMQPVSYTHLDVYKRQGKWYAETSGTEHEKRQKEIIDKNYKRAAGQINLSVLLPVFSCYI